MAAFLQYHYLLDIRVGVADITVESFLLVFDQFLMDLSDTVLLQMVVFVSLSQIRELMLMK